MRGCRPLPRRSQALSSARLGQAGLSTPRAALWPLHPELILSTCSFFSGRSCSNLSCKDFSVSRRRQMADDGRCPSLGGLPWVPGAPWHGYRGPRAAPGGEANVCAGGHAPGRADGSLGTMPILPLFPPGASQQGWGTAAGPSPEPGAGQGWVRSPQLLPGPEQGCGEVLVCRERDRERPEWLCTEWPGPEWFVAAECSILCVTYCGLRIAHKVGKVQVGR